MAKIDFTKTSFPDLPIEGEAGLSALNHPSDVIEDDGDSQFDDETIGD